MPQALEIDHEQVKCVAIQVGYREAARQFELKEETVLKWAQREGWSNQIKQATEAVAVKVERQGLSSVVRKTPSDIMLGFKGKTKLSQAKTVYKTAKHFEKLPGEVLSKKTSEVLNNVNAAAKLWPEESQTQQPLVNINLMGVSVPEAPRQSGGL